MKTVTEDEAFLKLATRCATAEHAPQELLRKMQEWGLNEESRQRVLLRLKEQNFTDEERYAHAFANDKFRYSGWGRIKIAQALRMKGIPTPLIEEACHRLPADLYKQKLEKLLTNKSRAIQGVNSYVRKAKLAHFAVGRGFEPDLVYRCMGEMDLGEDVYDDLF